jgi:hypothetical protein
MTITERVGVSVLEAGWVLGKTESQVRSLLRSGVLVYAVPPRRIDPVSVEALFDDDVRHEALEALLSGELAVPPPARRYGRPQPIFPFLLPHLLRHATLVAHSCGSTCGGSCQPGALFFDLYDSVWD